MRDVRGYIVKHRAGSLLLLLLLVSTLLMGLTADNRVIQPKQIVHSLFSSVQRGFAGVANLVRRFFSSIGELSQLRSRYSELQEELIRYRRDEREIIQLRQENAQLRDLLELSDTISYQHTAARVIGNDPSTFFNSLVIDRGSKHGLAVDMPVVAFQDGFQGLVGKITSVGPFTSQVLPLFDASCYVPARLENSRYIGLAEGAGSRFSLLTMRYVPKSARDQVSVGDLVVTSGMSSIYPPDIYLGRIRGVSAKTWEASLTLEIEPIVDFSRVEYVYVLEFLAEDAE